MLRKFKISNFKSFEKDFEIDLTNINGYEFNKSSIKDGIVNNAIIYGHNGVGKSNLALAIFDIIEHLTDKQRNDAVYKNYLNAYCNSDVSSFYYEFLINSKIVIYEYKKYDYKTIAYERLVVDNEELVLFDRTKNSSATIHLKGAETLKTEIENSELSILKYIKNNTALENNAINNTFTSLFTFVEQMLYFRSLNDRIFLGFDIGGKHIYEDIIKKKNVEDFEKFLNVAGIECKLSIVEELGKNTIAFNFNGKQLPFNEVASTGTISLALFYFWFQSIKENGKVSFVFIDEFDAFYHHTLSALIVEKLKETGVQFILTTHNTSIMTNDYLRPDCYFEMTKKHIRSLSRSTQKELREAHNIEKMYKAGSFDV
ncbi:ATP-binding protein [Flavobacterium psychrophilum]|uniref:AAA family ATPase n=1 Tax=Flavobacterium psychrophilum TaxID=96345 RepID=UPI0004F72EB0|nr:ATP-binding protein [Flavobacterium psychrophilum]AIN73621.1 chromosome segregation protein SMC [Flavobacterium psychrophilum FPG3]EKT2070369.1 ATP-binding protein [Flavobacterium psychrophilum]EKT2072729.1 ATP-binding protein [Flavobacterium psychrophilum]EKT4492182.1 ATP-binding protein [Flavobacterium psychrophilum]MBF2043603.1 ATP-binding protein [Flavobacterium psychrophilum]